MKITVAKRIHFGLVFPLLSLLVQHILRKIIKNPSDLLFFFRRIKSKIQTRMRCCAIRTDRGCLVISHCCAWQREGPVLTAYFSQQSEQPSHTAATYGSHFLARVFFTLSIRCVNCSVQNCMVSWFVC